MQAHNDNNIIEAWKELEADYDAFQYSLRNNLELLNNIKNPQTYKSREVHEKAAANFIWFIRFDYEFHTSEIEHRRNTMKIV